MLENTRHGGIGMIGNFYYSGILEKFTAQLLRAYHLPCKLQDPKVSALSGILQHFFPQWRIDRTQNGILLEKQRPAEE